MFNTSRIGSALIIIGFLTLIFGRHQNTRTPAFSTAYNYVGLGLVIGSGFLKRSAVK